MQIEELKTRMKSALHEWLNGKVDTLFKDSNGFNPVAYYMKNGIHNAFLRYDAQIDGYLDTLSMFVADEHGDVDADKLIDDFVQMFRTMPKQETQAGPMTIRYGGGEVTLLLPDNPVVAMLLPWRSIKFTADDLHEIKALM
ncbi:MAG: hypothetical protein ACI4C3_01065 [Bacteroides sp.]